MNQRDNCEYCESNSGGFFLGLVIGLMIGAVIAILIYRHNKSDVIRTLKRKINKFISGLENIASVKTTPVKIVRSKKKKSPPKTFVAK